MNTDLLWLAPAFFTVALVYSTVGFGGGTSYLALLALSGLPFTGYAPVSLTCNLVVASGALYHFRKAGHLSLPLVIPFLVTSIPFAFIGGRIAVDKRTFILLLAISLLIASGRLFLYEAPSKRFFQTDRHWLVGLPLGALLGFWSGLIGIGGGIFLSPLLMLLGWADSKKAAAAASLFILLNSASGLAGQWTKGIPAWDLIVPLGIAVLIGGQIGARLGAGSLSKRTLQRVTAVLILVVAVRLLGGLL